MECDFNQVQDDEIYLLVPEGNYLCRVADVRKGEARSGCERWSLRLEVSGGEHAGTTAAWDNLTWSDRGVLRIKSVLRAFGFDVEGTLSIEPEDLLGLQAQVTLEVEAYDVGGQVRRRMSVPYAGYSLPGQGDLETADTPLGGGEGGRSDAEASMPF